MNIGYVYKQQGNKNLAVENLLNAKKELMNALQYNENYHWKNHFTRKRRSGG